MRNACGQQCRDKARVREHHALGIACRAPGVEDAGHIITAPAKLGDKRRAPTQRVIGCGVHWQLPVADEDHAGCATVEFECREHRDEGIIDDKDLWRTVLERIVDLGRRPACVERYHHGRDAPAPELHFNIPITIEGEDGYPVAFGHAQIPKSACELLARAIERRPRRLACLEANGCTGRCVTRGALEELGQMDPAHDKSAPDGSRDIDDGLRQRVGHGKKRRVG